MTSKWVSELVYLTSLLNSQGFMSDGPGTGQWDEGWKAPRLEYTGCRTQNPVVWGWVFYCSTKHTTQPQNDLCITRSGVTHILVLLSPQFHCILLYDHSIGREVWGHSIPFPLGRMLTFAKLFRNVTKLHFTKFPKSETVLLCGLSHGTCKKVL